MPPARTGVASYSTDVLPGLRRVHEIDVFADEPSARAARSAAPSPTATRSAHDFLWERRLRPYDLTVFQVGNSSAHDFLWPYLFRFPGLAVLHDAHLQHARAAALLRISRAAEYRDEFKANHPAVSVDMAELAVKGFDSHLYYDWPMTKLVVEASRLTAVHSALSAATLRDSSPAAAVEVLRLGHGERITRDRSAAARTRVRNTYGIADAAVLFGVFGGLTPEKRLPQVLRGFAALLPYEPGARLLLAGARADHYDVVREVEALGIAEAVSITGYLENDDGFTDAVAACDVSINLRWPTAREVSGPWLRALAAGKPTITTDLAHNADVPALDPRNWTVSHASDTFDVVPEPVTIAIDILDEDHSLRLAMRRLATDPELRLRLGQAAAAFWAEAHSVDGMIADYNRVISRALTMPRPAVDLPAHFREDGSSTLRKLLAPFGLGDDLWGTI
jgi:glycosyltransferase involved in cell wall biosynthesis